MKKSEVLVKRIGYLCLWALPMVALQAQSPKTGPEVGQKVPAFSLQDQDDRTQTLTSVLGAKGALLVFFRSADW